MGATASIGLGVFDFPEGAERVRKILEKGRAAAVELNLGQYVDMSQRILAYAGGEDTELREEDVEDSRGFAEVVEKLDNEIMEPVIISGEISCLAPLNTLKLVVDTDEFKMLPICLNLSTSEGLSEEICSDPAILKVAMISLSGMQCTQNLFASAWTGWKVQNDITADNLEQLQYCALLSLDLSYTEIKIDRLAFLLCPLLKRLNLDGCNIATTVYEQPSKKEKEEEVEPWGVKCSIFLGLTSLKALSLAENPLPDAAALEGLRAITTLTSLNLTECPLREQGATSKEANKVALELVGPTLVTIDSQAVSPSTQTAPPQMGRIQNDNVAAGFTPGGGDLDAADKEFAQALRGEKDVTVVA